MVADRPPDVAPQIGSGRVDRGEEARYESARWRGRQSIAYCRQDASASKYPGKRCGSDVPAARRSGGGWRPVRCSLPTSGAATSRDGFRIMEKSTRAVFDRLGVDAVDLDGLTCCPEKTMVRNSSHRTWLLTAARNLSVAEEAGRDFVTPCTGCFGTLKGAAVELRSDPRLLERGEPGTGAQSGRSYRGDDGCAPRARCAPPGRRRRRVAGPDRLPDDRHADRGALRLPPAAPQQRAAVRRPLLAR